MMMLATIQWWGGITRNLGIHIIVQRMLCILFSASLSACATARSERTAFGPESAVVQYVAQEWAEHTDGRTYGGVIRPTGTLFGILGSYQGCLVEIRSRTLIVLSGAMEFHSSDDHSTKQHIFSKSLLGDQPSVIVPVGSSFTVLGSKIKTLPASIRLKQQLPQQCIRLRMFVTTTESMKLK
jgi:hypothetical protein